jgi:hypothetical protein
MCEGIVIEGHLLREMSPQVALMNGPLYDLLEWAVANCGIAMTDYIENHWETHCSPNKQANEAFWAWVTDQLKVNAMRHVDGAGVSAGDWRRIRVGFHAPSDPYVRAYIECAASVQAPRYLLAEDMDLHEPRARSLPTATQVQIRERRRGTLCQHLERALRVRVGTRADCSLWFEVDSGLCAHKASGNTAPCPRLP